MWMPFFVYHLFRSKKYWALLGWIDSVSNNRSIPYLFRSNVNNTKRCNRNECWHQNNCMNHANRYDCFETALKWNFLTVQKCSPNVHRFCWIFKLQLTKFHLPEPCTWHKRSKQSHSQYAHRIGCLKERENKYFKFYFLTESRQINWHIHLYNWCVH